MSELTSGTEAFELLLDSVNQRLTQLQGQISAKVSNGAFDAAQEDLQLAQGLKQLRDDLSALAEQYETLVEVSVADKEGQRLPPGLKTPQQAYRVPILKALVELGGEAKMSRVLERVWELMEDQLNKYDLATLSDGKTPRWRNTAQWARNSMREEGLIRDDSPYGIWAISEKGRRWLESR